jgi:hypothetical protein
MIATVTKAATSAILTTRLGVGLTGVWSICPAEMASPASERKGSRPASGAGATWLGLDGSLVRRGVVRSRRFRLRNSLGTFTLVVKVTDPARVRLFAVGTKFGAH